MTNLKMQLTQITLGGVILYLGCLLRGGQWKFHVATIWRELGAAARN